MPDDREARGDDGAEDDIQPAETEPFPDPVFASVHARFDATVPSDLDDFYLPSKCRGCLDDCDVPSVSEVVVDVDVHRDLRDLPCALDSDNDIEAVSLTRTLTDRRIAAGIDRFAGRQRAMQTICIHEQLDLEGDGSHADTELFTARLADEIYAEVNDPMRIDAGVDPDVAAESAAELVVDVAIYIRWVAQRNRRDPHSSSPCWRPSRTCSPPMLDRPSSSGCGWSKLWCHRSKALLSV